MQCFEADITCTGRLIPVFPFESTAVQACTHVMHTVDAWGLHLIMKDASINYLEAVTEVLHGFIVSAPQTKSSHTAILYCKCLQVFLTVVAHGFKLN